MNRNSMRRAAAILALSASMFPLHELYQEEEPPYEDRPQRSRKPYVKPELTEAQKLKKGLKPFTVNDRTVWALNEENAKRKYEKL